VDRAPRCAQRILLSPLPTSSQVSRPPGMSHPRRPRPSSIPPEFRFPIWKHQSHHPRRRPPLTLHLRLMSRFAASLRHCGRRYLRAALRHFIRRCARVPFRRVLFRRLARAKSYRVRASLCHRPRVPRRRCRRRPSHFLVHRSLAPRHPRPKQVRRWLRRLQERLCARSHARILPDNRQRVLWCLRAPTWWRACNNSRPVHRLGRLSSRLLDPACLLAARRPSPASRFIAAPFVPASR